MKPVLHSSFFKKILPIIALFGIPVNLYAQTPKTGFGSLLIFQIAGGVLLAAVIFLIVLLVIRQKKATDAQNAKDKKLKNIQKEKQDLEEKIRTNCIENAIATQLLTLDRDSKTLEEVIQTALDQLFASNCLLQSRKALIFTKLKNGNFQLVGHHQLKEVAKKYAIVKPISPGDEQVIPGDMKAYHLEIFPLRSKNKFLGVLNLYTDKNTSPSGGEEKEAVKKFSNYLSAIINEKQRLSEIENIKEEYLQKEEKLEKQFQTQKADWQQTVSEKDKELKKQSESIKQYVTEISDLTNQTKNLSKEIKEKQELFDQSNAALEQYVAQIEEKKREEEKIAQQMFAQKLEVEQKNAEIEKYVVLIEEERESQKKISEELQRKNEELEKIKAGLETDKEVLTQSTTVVEKYVEEIEKQKKQQEILNNQLFAQKMQLEQKYSDIEIIFNKLEEKNKEQEELNQQLVEQKEETENAYKNIRDSISYAETIQNALLPPPSLFQQCFNDDSFVLFKPKSTIGGDFYTLYDMNNVVIFAVADCTGHGVPGALITMLGLSFLEDIVNDKSITTTGDALEILRERIKKIFTQTGADEKFNKSGMDIALCAVDKEKNILQYSGAYNPLVIIRNEEIIELKPTRNPIGHYPMEKKFETSEIQLEKDDCLYLFSDGFIDQIGGDHGKKFMRKAFYNKLMEIHLLPMAEQKEVLLATKEKWQKDFNQVDDVTIMGIRWQQKTIH